MRPNGSGLNNCAEMMPVKPEGKRMELSQKAMSSAVQQNADASRFTCQSRSM